MEITNSQMPQNPNEGKTAPGEKHAAPENGFSFAMALSSLETQAARSLDIHGATPADDAVAEQGSRKDSAGNGSTTRPGNSTSNAQASNPDYKTSVPTDGAQQTTRAASAIVPEPVNAPQQNPVSVSTNATAQVAIVPTAPAAIAERSAAAKVSELGARTGQSDRAASKAATLKAPAQAQNTGQTTSDFARLVAHRLKEGASGFEMRLDPPSLGRIEGMLKVSDDGASVLALKFDSQEAMDLFVRDEAALRNLMSAAGFDLGQSNLSFQLRSENPATQTPIADQTFGEENLRSGAMIAAISTNSSGALDIHT